MTDIGHMTWGVLDNANDLYDIWRGQPNQRDAFGERELENIEVARKKLATLEQFILIHRNRKLKRGA